MDIKKNDEQDEMTKDEEFVPGPQDTPAEANDSDDEFQDVDDSDESDDDADDETADVDLDDA